MEFMVDADFHRVLLHSQRTLNSIGSSSKYRFPIMLMPKRHDHAPEISVDRGAPGARNPPSWS